MGTWGYNPGYKIYIKIITPFITVTVRGPPCIGGGWLTKILFLDFVFLFFATKQMGK